MIQIEVFLANVSASTHKCSKGVVGELREVLAGGGVAGSKPSRLRRTQTSVPQLSVMIVRGP